MTREGLPLPPGAGGKGAGRLPQKFNAAHMQRLESEERARRQPPARLLAAIGVGVGTRLADIGCGPGFYTLPAAELIGPSGRVYALDVQEPMLARVRQRAAAAGLQSIEALQSQESGLPLPDAAADVVLVANVLHECADRRAFLAEARRILAPGGSLAVIEWRREPMEMGPPLQERMGEEDVRLALREAGFADAAALEPSVVGPTHFGLLAPR